MNLTFLAASAPLAKSYALAADGTLTKESYPKVWEFTSHNEQVLDLKDFYAKLIEHADQGHCLLKGEVQRPLAAESRAGSTDPNNLTRWICLDVDRLGAGESISGLLSQLDLGNVTHIIQFSASYGVETGRGETGHVFMQLAKPMHPAALKQWLIHLNLTTPALATLITLTKTNNALSWPLDISTCQSDKLLYIAPPLLGEGVVSNYTGTRITLVDATSPTLNLVEADIPTAEANRLGTSKRLDDLRAANGLPKKILAFKTLKDGDEIISNPDVATLSGVKRERGFTYFNLNGGDSWGYYHKDEEPAIIRNFKGEPDYLTADLLPEYWSELERQRKNAKFDAKRAVQNPTDDRPAVLVFRDYRTALYYNGTWDPNTDRLSLARASSELQIQHYLKEKGLPEIDYIPVWNLRYDPQSDIRVDSENRTLNTYEKSSYMKLPPRAAEPAVTEFPTIHRLMKHAVGNDPALLEHWLNWWACLYQYRCRTMCAWVLHGSQGTGKGLLINKVLIPLLGAQNVVVKRMQEFEEQFNEHLERSQLVVIDEAQISETKQSRILMANLKNMITEPQISIRRMRTDSYLVENYCNFMILSNQPDPVTLEVADRRFNVGAYQPLKLVMEDDFLEKIEAELEAFAQYSKLRTADRKIAMTVFESADRDAMIATSTNSLEATAQAVLTGDLEFFWDALPAGEMGMLGVEAQMLHESYTKLVHEALTSTDPDYRLTRDELRVLFAYNVGDVPRTPAKFTSMLRHHRVHTDVIRIHGRNVRGVKVNWKKDPQWLQDRLIELEKKPTAKVVNINSVAR